LIVFYQNPFYINFFEEFIDQREKIKEIILNNLSKKTFKKYEQLPSCLLGIHLRRGDFPAQYRISNEDIIKIINFFNNRYNKYLPINIFTDSPPALISDILKIPNVKYENSFNVMIDLLKLSKCKIIIPSAYSTFSNWACFLSNGIVLRHPKDIIKKPIRNSNLFIETYFNENFNISDKKVLEKIDEIIETHFKNSNF